MYAEAETWNPFKGCNSLAPTAARASSGRPSGREGPRARNPAAAVIATGTPPIPMRIGSQDPQQEDRLCVRQRGHLLLPAGLHPQDHRRMVKAHMSGTERRHSSSSRRARPTFASSWQSSRPKSILLTTLETNRDKGYKAISKAPPPSVRYEQFRALKYPRKVVTIEPVTRLRCRTFVRGYGVASGVRLAGLQQQAGRVELPEPPRKGPGNSWQILWQPGSRYGARALGVAGSRPNFG